MVVVAIVNRQPNAISMSSTPGWRNAPAQLSQEFDNHTYALRQPGEGHLQIQSNGKILIRNKGFFDWYTKIRIEMIVQLVILYIPRMNFTLSVRFL